MKLAIIFAMNNRPAQSGLFFLGLARLRQYHDIAAFAGVTTDDDASECRRHGVGFAQLPNSAPDKFNAALALAMQSDAEAFIVMGDDDLISTEGVQLLIDALSGGAHYAGFKTNGFYDMTCGKAYAHTQPYSVAKLIGAGRIISRAAIERVLSMVSVRVRLDHHDKSFPIKQFTTICVPKECAEYMVGYNFADRPQTHGKLWPDGLKSRLDHYSEMRLVLAGFAPVSVDDGRVHVTDFKHLPGNNIWPMSSLEPKCKDAQPEDVIWFLNDHERQYLRDALPEKYRK